MPEQCPARSLKNRAWTGVCQWVKLESAANLSFSLQTTAKAKLTLWAVSYKNGKYSVTSKGSVTVTSGYGAMKAKLVEAGDYFVSVESSTAKSGGSAYYNVGISTDTVFFDSADYSTKTTGNGWCYDKKTGINQDLMMNEVFESGTYSMYLDNVAVVRQQFAQLVAEILHISRATIFRMVSVPRREIDSKLKSFFVPSIPSRTKRVSRGSCWTSCESTAA